MSNLDPTTPPAATPPAATPPPAYTSSPPPPAYAQAPPPPAPVAYSGAVGKVRPTGVCILLAIVTLGIYTWFWYYNTHEEMKQHTGQGIGGIIALLLAVFVGPVLPFLSSSEVGNLYKRAGQPQPVSALTGLWAVPFGILIIPAIVWFVKTNGALNTYWQSQGATA